MSWKPINVRYIITADIRRQGFLSCWTTSLEWTTMACQRELKCCLFQAHYILTFSIVYIPPKRPLFSFLACQGRIEPMECIAPYKKHYYFYYYYYKAMPQEQVIHQIDRLDTWHCNLLHRCSHTWRVKKIYCMNDKLVRQDEMWGSWMFFLHQCRAKTILHYKQYARRWCAMWL